MHERKYRFNEKIYDTIREAVEAGGTGLTIQPLVADDTGKRWAETKLTDTEYSMVNYWLQQVAMGRLEQQYYLAAQQQYCPLCGHSLPRFIRWTNMSPPRALVWDGLPGNPFYK